MELGREEQAFMSSDELLSCFIYVLVKSGSYEMPALLTIINYFTLDEHQFEFEFISTTLNAAVMFVRTELVKLCEPTLHYTYIDGKSCFGDKNFLPSHDN